MNNGVLKLGLLFTLLLFMCSCIKDNFNYDKLDKEIEYNGSFVFPLAYGDLNILDMFKLSETDQGLIETKEGLSLVYKTTIKTDVANNVLSLSDQNLSGVLSDSDFNSKRNSKSSLSKTINMGFTMFNDEAKIDSILFKSGDINISLSSTFSVPIEINVKFPSIKKDGVVLEFTINLDNPHEIKNNNANLSQYFVDFTKTSVGYNEIPVEVTLSYSAANLTAGQINYNIDIRRPKYSVMYGYFGVNTLLYQKDSMDITIFKSDKIRIEKYSFEDPKFNIFYENSYGIPSQVSFPELSANFSTDESDHNLLTEFGFENVIGESNPFQISYPSAAGAIAKDSLKISNNPDQRGKYADISGIIRNMPRWINLTLKASTNPNNTFSRNFVTENSKIEADVVIDLPLYGYLSAYYDSDTLDINLSDFFKDYDPIKKLVIKINVKNGFPIELGAKIKFTDANYNELDILSENLLNAAEVNTNGNVISPSINTVFIEYNAERIEKIKDAKYIIYEAHCQTTDANSNKAIRIQKDYKLNFNIGIETVIEFKGDIDSISNSL